MMLEFEKFLNAYVYELRARTDETLCSAIDYALNSGGKRVRPKLMLLTADVIGLNKTTVMPFALAIECIHTYSLIHDDLPAIDNDDFRRGRLTVHKAYDYATAILAGDALLNTAFEIVANHSNNDSVTLAAISRLATSSGISGMIGGQIKELKSTCHTCDDLLDIYSKKTGALISASISIPCIINNVDKSELAIFDEIGNAVGLIFQLVDDLLDVEKEIALGKTTFVTLMGKDNTNALIKEQNNILINLFAKSSYDCTLLSDYVKTLSVRNS
ncbi:MAG: polyprenyl synthetase family protein [Christensenellaceae bacterium]|jgi:geranylgeranyl diphosphate synthase type II|nr:polyprenyl synthetase family protein [Christensenellaceae bacterium]